MKLKHQLLGYPKYVIFQKEDLFKFTIDSMLLSGFVNLKYDVEDIIDLGTGNAAIPIYLTLKTKANIYGIEIQREVYDLGVMSVLENKLDQQITLIHDDLKNAKGLFKDKLFDVVTCNPPYFKYQEGSNINKNDYLTIARHEVKTNLEEIISVTYKLLKDKGSFFMIHRPDRLTDIIYYLRKHKLEPKKVRFVHPHKNKKANHILIEAVKNGNPGSVELMAPLYIYEGNKLTKEVLDIYNYRRKEDASK